jgi:hypothetical protein
MVKINEMEVGEFGYIPPWLVFRDQSGRLYVNNKTTITPEAIGSVNIRITRVYNGVRLERLSNTHGSTLFEVLDGHAKPTYPTVPYLPVVNMKLGRNGPWPTALSRPEHRHTIRPTLKKDDTILDRLETALTEEVTGPTRNVGSLVNRVQRDLGLVHRHREWIRLRA